MLKTLLKVALVSSLVLTGCFDSTMDKPQDGADPLAPNESDTEATQPGGNQDTPTTTVAGVVADGYLVGAKICLDTNANGVCDIGEPSTITTVGGQYEMAATLEQLEQYNMLVEVTTTTVDEDTGTTVEKPYKLTTPVGKNEFISPISTLVQGMLAIDPAMTQEKAEQRLVNTLGINTEDLYDDFVANTNLKDTHTVARVVATAMGNAKEAFGNALVSSDDNAAALSMIATELIISNLNTIAKSAALAGDSADIKAIATSTVGDAIQQAEKTIGVLVKEKNALSDAVVVTPKSAFADELYALSISQFESMNQETLLLESPVVVRFHGNLLNPDSEWINRDCERSWNIEQKQSSAELCNEYSSSDSDNYEGVAIAVNDQGVLTKFNYNSESSGDEWVDDYTLKSYTDYFLNGIKVYSEAYIDELTTVAIPLGGLVISDYINETMGLTVGNTEYGIHIDVDSPFELNSQTVFSNDAKAIIYTVTENDQNKNFDSYLQYYSSALSKLDMKAMTLDDLIDANGFFSYDYCPDYITDCSLGYPAGMLIKLNSSTGAIAGNATFHIGQFKEQGTISEVGEIIITVPWSKTIRYGRDAIVFDTTNMSAIDLFHSIISLETGSFAIENEDSDANTPYSIVKYNKAAADDMKAVVYKYFDDTIAE